MTRVNVRVARVHTRSASDGDPGTRGGSGRCAAAAAVFSAAWRGRSDWGPLRSTADRNALGRAFMEKTSSSAAAASSARHSAAAARSCTCRHAEGIICVIPASIKDIAFYAMHDVRIHYPQQLLRLLCAADRSGRTAVSIEEARCEGPEVNVTSKSLNIPRRGPPPTRPGPGARCLRTRRRMPRQC